MGEPRSGIGFKKRQNHRGREAPESYSPIIANARKMSPRNRDGVAKGDRHAPYSFTISF